MAFVFEQPRWKIKQIAQDIGPGSYCQFYKFQQKLGIITPQRKPLKKKDCSFKQKSINCQIITTQKQNQKRQKSKSKLKKQAVFRKIDMNKTIKCQQVCFEVQNCSQGVKQFQNNFIKNSIGQINKNSIHSANTSIHKKNIFADNKIRNLQSKKVDIQQIKKICISQSQSQNDFNMKKLSKHPDKRNKFVVQLNKDCQNNQKQNFIIASRNIKRQKRQIISVKNIHPKKMKNCQNSFNDFSLTTRLEDQSDNSFQYIQNTTPGPGTYDINKSAVKLNGSARIQQFGVKQYRFKPDHNNKKMSFQNFKIPDFKKCSRASQQKVAFGKSHQNAMKQKKQDMLLYKDYTSLQNKSLKKLNKYKNKQQNFLSNCERFHQINRQVYKGPDFLPAASLRHQNLQLPNYIFMSKVVRSHSSAKKITNQIDFLGQDFYSIEKNIKIMEQNKQIAQVQPPGFWKSESRFKYPDTFQELEIAKNTKNNTRATSAMSHSKAYTFCKSQGQIFSGQTPAPWKYTTPQNWIKQSHHIRFKFN